MNALRAVTWNAEGMFVEGTRTRRATPHDAVHTIKRLEADVIVVPEFGFYAQLDGTYRNALAAYGYRVIEVPYEDNTRVDDNKDVELGLAVLTRLPVVSTETHRLGGTRNCCEVIVRDEQGERLRVIAVHLDDKSEESRLRQADTLADIVNSKPQLPTLVMGDFNAMHTSSKFARMAKTRVFARLSRAIPNHAARYYVSRVHEMALGTTIGYILQMTKLRDLDPSLKRTITPKTYGAEWLPALRVAKIDWIFGTRQFKTRSYRVQRDVGSDHRPVVADLSY